MPTGEYHGRLAADGNGNLLAWEEEQIGEQTVTVHDSEGNVVTGPDGNALTMQIPIIRYGENHGLPVAADPDTNTFVFVQAGEPSHNQRHHKQFATSEWPNGETRNAIEATVAADQTDDASLVNVGDGVNEHHLAVLPTDPNYDPTAPDDVRMTFDADAVAPFVTGHTDAYETPPPSEGGTP
jgi:hypothetical protein